MTGENHGFNFRELFQLCTLIIEWSDMKYAPLLGSDITTHWTLFSSIHSVSNFLVLSHSLPSQVFLLSHSSLPSFFCPLLPPFLSLCFLSFILYCSFFSYLFHPIPSLLFFFRFPALFRRIFNCCGMKMTETKYLKLIQNRVSTNEILHKAF